MNLPPTSHAEFRARQKLGMLPHFHLGVHGLDERLLREFQGDLIGVYVNSEDPLDAIVIGPRTLSHITAGGPAKSVRYADIRSVRVAEREVVCVLTDQRELVMPVMHHTDKFLDATSMQMFLVNMIGASARGLP